MMQEEKEKSMPPAAVEGINPKDAVGVKKVPLSTVPCGPILLAGLAMLEGARKYGRHNYRAAGVRASVYYDAVVARHIMPWWEGQDIDPDSGLNHIDKAIAGLLVLRDSMLLGNWVDDRPIRNPIDLKELNAKAAGVVERYPDAVAPFIEVGEAPAPGEILTCGECEHFAGTPANKDGELCHVYGMQADRPRDPGCFAPKGGA